MWTIRTVHLRWCAGCPAGWSSGTGAIWLERGCPDHGLVRTLYDESPEILRYLEQWTAPTKTHVPDVRGNFDPVPSAYLRGLPEMQTQHTCILLADITAECNLRCPTCFTDSSPELTGVAPLADVLASIDTRLSRENGRIDVLMLSGGEPTLYPYLAELLREVAARNVIRVLVNTNGLRIAREDALLDLLAEHRDRVEVYLQYDGDSAEASRHHRGGDLRQLKDRAVERLSGRGHLHHPDHDGALGANDDEIGAVVKRALDTPYVGGVSLQPQFGSGRSGAIDWSPAHPHRGAATARAADRRPGDLARPDRAAVLASALLLGGLPAARRHGEWRSLTALIGHDRLLEFLDLAPDVIANRIADVRAALGPAAGREGLAAGPALRTVVAVAPPGRRAVARHLRELRPRHLHPADPRLVRPARWPGPAAQAAGRAGQADHRQTVHGHGNDD